MNYHGLEIGAVMIAMIGLGHVLVIKWEYYLGARSWPGMLVLGLGLLVASLFPDNMLLSAVLGMAGATLLWGIHELLRQEKRVQQGLFPCNPRQQKRPAGRR